EAMASSCADRPLTLINPVVESEPIRAERQDHAGSGTGAAPLRRAQDDGNELLRLLILAVLAKAERPRDPEEVAERVVAALGVQSPSCTRRSAQRPDKRLRSRTSD